MKKDGRLSGVLHIILHLAQAAKPVTSERLAVAMKTNPVVVRRTLSDLRDRGIVSSEKGHGGGWQICCNLKTTSLLTVYDALGAPDCIALTHRDETSTCLVEQAVNTALSDAFEEAEKLLLTRLGQITLADLSANFHSLHAICEIGLQGEKQ